MRIITFRDVIYKGKSLLDCLIDKDMDLDQVTAIFAKKIKELEKATSLKGLNLKGFNIDTCNLDGKTLLVAVLKELIDNDIDVAEQFSKLQQNFTTLSSNLGQTVDEKVKASDTDDSPGFLTEKLHSTQSGTIAYDEDNKRIVFSGFMPVGCFSTIHKSRLPDFDNTGKGKVDTDVYGFAIRNGLNGTENVLGHFPRYVDEVANAGNKGGSDEVKIAADQVPSLDFAITGEIADSLTAEIKAEIRLEANKISDGSGGNVYLLRVGNGQTGTNKIHSLGMNLKHKHNHSLRSKYDNAAQKNLVIVPKNVFEIPIQRIF